MHQFVFRLGGQGIVFPKGNRLLGFLVWGEVPLPEMGNEETNLDGTTQVSN